MISKISFLPQPQASCQQVSFTSQSFNNALLGEYKFISLLLYLPSKNEQKTRSIGLAILPQHRSAFPPLLSLEFPMFSDSILGLILYLGAYCCPVVFLSFSTWFVPKVTLNKIPYIGFPLACLPGSTTMTQSHLCLVLANSLKFSAF